MSQPPAAATAPIGTTGAAGVPASIVQQQSSMRHYFASSKASGGGGGGGSSSSGSATPDRKQTHLRASLEGGGMLSLAPAAASAATPAAHSSLPFAHPPSDFAPSAPASAFSSPPSSASVSPAASVASSASSSARRRKRDRHSDDSDGDADVSNGTGGVAAAAAKQLSALSPCVCKLPARTLLYQLHVLRADEKMVIRGVETRGARVGGGGGVELRVQSAAEQEAEEAALEAADSKLRAATAASACASSSHASSFMSDGEEKGEPIELAESDEEEEEEALEPLSAVLPAVAHPLFPESQEFVSLFLSASAAHARFQQLRASWSARGVRNVRARVMEFQLTQPVQLLMVASEAQKQAWMGSAAAAAPAFADRMDDEATPSASSASAIAAPISQASQLPLRASPFSKPTPMRLHRNGAPAAAAALFAPAAAAAAAAAAASSHSSSSPATPAVANPSQSSLYAPPVVPSALRSVLDSRDDTLSGFCISAALGAGAGASVAPAPGEVVEASEATVLGGEVTLQSGVCAQRLHILDDDKKGRWSQQLLTDLFGRMDMGKQQHAAAASVDRSGGSSGSCGSHGRSGHSAGHSVVRSLPFHQLSVSGTSAAFSSSSSSHASSSLQLAPSSFAPHVAAGLLQPLNLPPPPREQRQTR